MPDSAKISGPLLVVPEMLIREDFSRFRLGAITEDNSQEITGAYKID